MTYKDVLENLFSKDSPYRFVIEESSNNIRIKLLKDEKFIIRMELEITPSMDANECYKYFLEKMITSTLGK